MTPSSDRPWLIYDQRCELCRWLVDWLDRRGWLVKAQAVSIMDAAAHMPLDLLDQTVTTALLYDPGAKTAVGGLDAFVQLVKLHQPEHPFVRLYRFKPLAGLARWGYRFVSQHRRTLSPVAPAQDCSVCRPPETSRTFWTFTAVCLMFWLVATGGWGAMWALSRAVDPVAGMATAWWVTGCGWLLALGQIPLLHRLGLDRPWQEVRELTKQMLLLLAFSALPLIGASAVTGLLILAGWGPSAIIDPLNLLALAASAALVLALWQKRRQILQYPALYPIVWAIAWTSGLLAGVFTLRF